MSTFPIDRPRAAGLETEYGFHPQPDSIGNNQLLYSLPLDIRHTDMGFLSNGARLYADQSKNAEYCLPECVTSDGLLAAHFAGEELTTYVINSIFNGKYVTQKRTSDSVLKMRGDHENYSINHSDADKVLGPQLLTLLAVRSLLTGPGFIHERGNGNWSYSREPRIWSLSTEEPINSNSTDDGKKPFILSRSEDFDNTDTTKRLQILSGSHNMFAFPILARIMSVKAGLRLIEHGAYPDNLVVANPAAAGRLAALDLDGKQEIELDNGKSYTAANILYDIIDSAKHFADKHNDLPQDERDFVYMCLPIANDIVKGNYDPWKWHLEWYAKYAWLRNKMEKEGLGWGSPRTRQREIKWHSLDTENVVFKLRQAGRVACMPSRDAIEAAKVTAPDNTRAARRGQAIKASYPFISEADWHTWKIGGRQTHADNVLEGLPKPLLRRPKKSND